MAALQRSAGALPNASLPFNGAGRLGGVIVGDAIDAAHLVDDAGGDAGQEVAGELERLGGHARSCAGRIAS